MVDGAGKLRNRFVAVAGTPVKDPKVSRHGYERVLRARLAEEGVERGFDVTVLEAHVEPGGCAATFFHKGYRFDVGATLVGGFHHGGSHQIVGEQLGMTWPIRAVEPAMQVHLPEQTITRWSDADRWREERLPAVPRQRWNGIEVRVAPSVIWSIRRQRCEEVD